MSNKKIVHIVSGPLGVGKTSVAKELVKLIDNCVLLEGDGLFLALEVVETVSWEERLRLTWKNILSVTKNYLEDDLNVRNKKILFLPAVRNKISVVHRVFFGGTANTF